jgi:ABC-2 type transport system ATP-binding protein
MPIVETQQLSKTYRTGYFRRTPVIALSDVSIQVNAGEIFGLLGPNGAGKTTFVKLLLSVVRPTSGTASVLERPIGAKDVRALCGYLPENHRYPPFLTASETLYLFGELNGTRKSLLKDRVDRMLELVGLKNWANQKTHRFSKGMLQRLGLAQALLHEPKVLFLDEPTDGVDPVGRKEMRDLFLKLRSEGVTIFLNSHLLSEVEMISDRVAILNKGALIKVGTLDEVRGGQTTHQIRILGPLTPQQQESIRDTAEILPANGSSTVLSVKTDADLNRTIDRIRSWGLMIQSINQRKSSLEETFVKLVTDGSAK